MFFFFFDVNNSNIAIGTSPKEADVAIVSINSKGSVGELNKFVLKEYDYDESVLKQLQLKNGFQLFKNNGKSILFVVTIGNGSTENSLRLNLYEALKENFEALKDKKIWIPLMGTGIGRLSYRRSYEITISVLNSLKDLIQKYNCQFIISLPRDKKGQALYDEINQSSSVTHPDIKHNNFNLGNSIDQTQLKELKKLKDSTTSLIEDDPVSKINSQTNIRTIPGILSDTETGEDYLDIKKDIEAFSRVVAAKNFEPPLAIALLGKWGSGKSFFMQKMKNEIQNLSKYNPQNVFCESIAHVHFNSWSYMDANLWASIVTRIFESLENYIKDSGASDIEKKKIEKELFQKLNISKEELKELNGLKEKIISEIKTLKNEKKNIKKELKQKISQIKKTTLISILKKVDKEFKVQQQIEDALNNNPTFVSSLDKFKKIIPEEYWNNPTAFYKELKSGYTFTKLFFRRNKWRTNICWLIGIIILIILVPILTYIVNLLISWQDFTLTKTQIAYISLFSAVLARGIDTYIKIKKLIAPFWEIKEKYEIQKENALFSFIQNEKALKLKIKDHKKEITNLDKQINSNLNLKVDIEFKLKNALSTQALYNFIEKRANSDDYKKHLGIVSLIRKDLEILSSLLTEHRSELVTNTEAYEFKKMFRNKKPLERIILYIDDLDRCPEERVVEVLEAVNLLLAFPLFVVIVGIDPRWVKIALKEKYKNQFTESTHGISPSNYLEKIFQVPFHLKDANDTTVKNMIEKLAKTTYNLDPIIQNKKSNVIQKESIEVSIVELDENDEQKITSTISIPESLEDEFDSNKNKIEALNITNKEIQQIKSLAHVIGNNPRCIKRFLNIYRIVKTHEDFDYKSYEKENELLVIMFLLALPMGIYNPLSTKINNLIESQEEDLSISYFLSKDYNTIEDELYKMKKNLNNFLLMDNSPLLKLKFNDLKKHYNFIKRFTFKNI